MQKPLDLSNFCNLTPQQCEEALTQLNGMVDLDPERDAQAYRDLFAQLFLMLGAMDPEVFDAWILIERQEFMERLQQVYLLVGTLDPDPKLRY
jgi:hypothetical protein